MPSRHVKGVLFSDYVRMLRARKDVDWTKLLPADDHRYLVERVEPDAWYPMQTFERFGNAILMHVAGDDMELVRLWGYHSAEDLRRTQPMLVAPGDPVETLGRFRVLRASYFDFEALQLPLLHDDEAEVAISYGMGALAEEAASWQTMGFFQRLLELADATDVTARFSLRSWAGDARTILSLAWRGRF